MNFLILECKCSPNRIDNIGRTPLHCACLGGFPEVVKYLATEHKCNPELGNNEAPLHIAANRGHLAVVQYLIMSLVVFHKLLRVVAALHCTMHPLEDTKTS